MIEILKDFPGNVLAIRARERISAEDYKETLVPAVDEALKIHERLRIYYEIDSDFTGIDAGAIWEDFMLGMGRLFHWEKIAIVTDIDWIRNAVYSFGFFMPCPVKTFSLAEKSQARQWITKT